MIEKYYINWSRITGYYIVYEVGVSWRRKVFKTKREAEQYIKQLNEQ
jgi:hypothetical protein